MGLATFLVGQLHLATGYYSPDVYLKATTTNELHNPESFYSNTT